MKTMNVRTRLAAAAMLLAVFGCEKAPETDISKIIARNTDARGGAAALDAVQALEVNRTVQEGSRQFTTHYVVTRDGRMRMDVRQDGSTIYSEGYDGQSAWQRRGVAAPADDMPDWAVAAAKRALRHNLYALHQLAASGTEFVLVDREKVAGGLYNWVVEATDPDGYKRRLYFDPSDFLVTRVQESSALNPTRTNYPEQLDTYFSDYREIDGVFFSFESETYTDEAGQALQKTKANKIIVNPEFEPTIFTRPADDNDAADGDSSTEDKQPGQPRQEN